ncbi:MAG: hypothetical protein D6753_18260 [Planctomycetota bacterium]|nr:MAG: hypothetical protein D6753_18260 [Planctomycetota bacterium]
MKIKNLLLSLSLAGCCLNPAVMAADLLPTANKRSIGDGQPVAQPVKSIGDGGKSIGDTPSLRAPIPAFPAVATRSRTTISDAGIIAPTAFATGTCDSGGACDTGSACDLASACNTCRPSTWFGAESLLWFGQKQEAPPIITTAPMTTVPIAGNPGVTTQFGGEDGIDFGLLPGFRLSGGRYLDACQKIGVGGRIYGILPAQSDYSITSNNGDPSVGLPFFNADPNVLADSAQLIAYHDGNQLQWSGSATVRADMEMYGSDGSLHLLLARSCDHRVDMLAGYTYNNLKSSIDLRTTRVNSFTGDLIPDGTIFRSTDLFETENEFNGAHLGILSSVVRNRMTFNTLAKVSFGNMHQWGQIAGSSEQEFGGTVTPGSGGFFAQPSNIGSFSRNRFAFIPELGINAAYCIRPNVKLSVGYTFMYWSSVALAGEQMSSIVDPTQTVSQPSPTNAIGSYWMQGIDLGTTITF